MSRVIFINIPVVDLSRSKAFYTALGFTNNPQFSDETAACMVLSDTINVMLLTHEKWRTFTSRPIPPTDSSEVLLAISCNSKEEVDAMNKAAAENGGTAHVAFAQILRPERFVPSAADFPPVQSSGHANFQRCLADKVQF